MLSDGWHFTEDYDRFPRQAREFLRSRPALHTTLTTAAERMRTGAWAAAGGPAPVLGRLERAGGVRAVLYRARGLTVSALTADEAGELAARLAAAQCAPDYVTAEHDTALAFADAWRRETGTTPSLRVRLHLYRLGTLTPPEPFPAGRGRVLGERDHEDVMRWCRGFAAAVGDPVVIDAGTWAGTAFAAKRFTFWESPDGTPVAIAGATPQVDGMVRVDPVYTPAAFRGRGYGAAVTAEVTRAALAAGASDVVLYTDPGNPTSNALYRRLGYERLTDFAVYDLVPAAVGAAAGAATTAAAGAAAAATTAAADTAAATTPAARAAAASTTAAADTAAAGTGSAA